MGHPKKYTVAIKWSYVITGFLLFFYSIIMIYGLAYPLKPNRIIETWFFSLLMHHYLPRTWRAITWFSALIILLYYPTSELYGRPSFGIVASLISTNAAEAGEYLRTIPIKTYLVSIMLAAMVFLIGYWVYEIKAPAYRRPWILSGFMILAISIMANNTARKGYAVGGFPFRIQPIEFLADVYLMPKAYFSELEKIQINLNQPNNWQITKTHQRYRNHVLIIGESARADYMHLYGFKYNNTPFLDEHANIIMQNMLSSGPNTPISLLHGLTLTKGSAFSIQNNIITLANKAGMATVWLSNQGGLGKYDTSISIIAHQAYSAHFLKSTEYDFGNRIDDNALLPWLEKTLQQPLAPQSNRLIVMHLMGSHPEPCERLRQQPYHYVDNPSINCYIDSLRQTDDDLAAMYQLLMQTGQSFSMLYFSDHGLSYDKNIFGENLFTLPGGSLRHNDKYYQNYHIPLVVINSDGHGRIRNPAKRSGFELLGGLADWLGIESPQLPSAKTFFQNQDSPQRQVLDMNKQLHPADQLGNDALPEALQ